MEIICFYQIHKKYEDYCHLECDTIQPGRIITYQTTLCNITDDSDFHTYHYENLKSYAQSMSGLCDIWSTEEKLNWELNVNIIPYPCAQYQHHVPEAPYKYQHSLLWLHIRVLTSYPETELKFALYVTLFSNPTSTV